MMTVVPRISAPREFANPEHQSVRYFRKCGIPRMLYTYKVNAILVACKER